MLQVHPRRVPVPLVGFGQGVGMQVYPAVARVGMTEI